MAKYHITNYTRKQAHKLGVRVCQSTNPAKKIDVYDKKGVKVASVGANGMNDYPTYILKKGATFAKTRRRLYRIRHTKDRKKKGTPGWYADKLLW